MGVVVYYLMDRLRQVVGSCWDYCVIWKLNEDPWLLECVDCCCGGSYDQKNEEEFAEAAPETVCVGCKDGMFSHPRTRSCDLLSHLPPSLPLDGINAEVLITNQPRWLNSEEMMESKVLIPVPGGLVEFYASKMVPEDQSLIDYVVSQCSALSEQAAMNNVDSNNMNMNMNMNMNQLQSGEFLPYSPSTALANLNLSGEDATATADRIRICNSAMTFLQQFSYLTETPNSNNKDEGDNNETAAEAATHDHTHSRTRTRTFTRSQQQHNIIVNGNENEEGDDENGAGPRGESGSDSDPIDDDEDSRGRRKNGKGTSKNLIAERKRRKKLNERLYLLRSLVPKISKLDRAAILGDAIDYVMELQQQERELKNELEHNSDDGSSTLIVDHYSPATSSSTLKRAAPHDEDHQQQQQQMEVQVEVAHLDGNEFFIKVFGEQKGVCFVSLIEALHSLGFDITTVNGTSCISLVSYVFTVEKKDSEMVQAEYLRDSLLQMTRNQSTDWPHMAKPADTREGSTHHHHLDQFQNNHYFQQHQFHPFQ